MSELVRNALEDAVLFGSQESRWRLYLALVAEREVSEAGGPVRLHDSVLRALSRVERVVARRDAGFSTGRPVPGGSGMLADALRDLVVIVVDVRRSEAEAAA